SPLGTTGNARMVYNRVLESGEVVVSYREWNDPATEGTANVIAEGGRFLGTEPSVLTLTRDANNFTQILLIDIETGDGEIITDTPTNKINPFIWFAPEFNDLAFVVMLDFTDLAVYRRVDGVWTEYNRFVIPAQDKPLLSSPEAFSHNGRSYITVVAAETLGQSDTFPGQPVGPSEIWLAGIDPANPFFRRIDDPTSPEQRSEPEPYMLDSGPVAYYTEKNSSFPFNRILRRADMGLGPDLAYELPVSYGGAWAGINRDNRNCNCVPFPLATDFVAGEPSDVPGVQLSGAALASDHTLLFTNNNTVQQAEELIAFDTQTGTEKFRLSESDLGPGLANSPVLVDRDDSFFVSAQNLIAKYAPDGSQLWSTPLAGYSVGGAQFLPNGLMILFTWNGFAYVIDPTNGGIVLEQNLTPNRTYPAGPACLVGGAPSTCAYTEAPAVDGTSGTIFVSFIRGNDRGLVQAFDYDANLNQLVNRWGAASIALSAPGSAPVLNDRNNLFVQVEDGRLLAINPALPRVRWAYQTGTTSRTPPVVQGDRILPGGVASEGATSVTVLLDTRGGPIKVFESADFLPRSFAAADANGRFVMAVENALTRDVRLGVIDAQAGTLTTSPWAAGGVPATLRAVTVRQDGAVIAQGWGASNNVAVFAPAQ
ncbi:MAG: PQQ-binding-like beta-propeller repeat protein, partial [Pseudomonadota bacterium]